MIRIVVPMGGEGKPFVERGYTFPKPLIEIAGRPMIDIVVQNLTPNEPHKFIFICREEHMRNFSLGDVLRLVSPNCEIVAMQRPSAGALCSVLLGMEFFVDDDELLVANADQYIDDALDSFLAAARGPNVDGCIMVFPSTHPKWSYVKVEEGEVVAVAEKRPISRQATTGLYYFRRGYDFVEGAEKMLLKNATVAGEFYVCPVYNELILMGKHITIFAINRNQMHSLGTPEDVDTFAKAKAHKLTL